MSIETATRTDYHRCENCDTRYLTEQLAPIKDLLSRVSPGEPLPSGECPNADCGALCQPATYSEDPNVVGMRYTESHQRCPFCLSHSITGHQIDIEDSTLVQEVSCNECQQSWTDVYKLVGIQFVGLGQEEYQEI